MEIVSSLVRKPDEVSAEERANIVRNAEDEWRLPNLATVLPPEHLHPIVKLRRARVTIYRAVPEEATEIRPGDWVALSADIAHGMGRGKVLSKTVPASDVVWAGTDVNEYFYVPMPDSSP